MTYSIPALIAYNLSQLRRHMLNAGATDQQWRDGLLAMARIREDPENIEPYGAQNHEAP